MGANDKQASAATPAPRKSGGMVTILWVLIIISLIAGGWLWKMKGQVENIPSVKKLIAKAPQLAELDTKTQSQIEQEGEAINAVDLAKAPDTVQGRYVVVDGTVQSSESGMVNENLAAADFSSEAFTGDKPGEYKGYVLDDGVVLIDITGEQKNEKGGQALRGYGMVVTVDIDDIWALPFVGEDLKKQYGSLKGTAKQVIFVFSKGVKEIKDSEITRSKGGDMAKPGATPPGAPSLTPGATPPGTPPTTPPGTPPTTPPGTPPTTPPGTPPTAPPGTPPTTPPGTPPTTPPGTPPGAPPAAPPAAPPSAPPAAPPSAPPATPPGGGK